MFTRSLATIAIFAWLLAPISALAGDHFRLKSGDKQLHVAAAYGCSLTSTLLLEKYRVSRAPAVLWASLFTLALGTAKELLVDSTHSPGDQLANAIGVAGSAAMVFTFEF